MNPAFSSISAATRVEGGGHEQVDPCGGGDGGGGADAARYAEAVKPADREHRRRSEHRVQPHPREAGRPPRAQKVLVDRVGEQHIRKPAEATKPHHPDVELAAVSPLDAKAEGEECVAARLDQHPQGVGGAQPDLDETHRHHEPGEQGEPPSPGPRHGRPRGRSPPGTGRAPAPPPRARPSRRSAPPGARAPLHNTRPRKIPVGRQTSTTTRMKKGTTILYSGGDEGELGGDLQGLGSTGASGRSSTDQLNTDSVSAKPTRNPPAIAP